MFEYIVLALILFFLMCRCMKGSENFTIENRAFSVKWNTKGGFNDASKLVFVRSVDGKNIEVKEVTSSDLNYDSGEVSFVKPSKGNTNTITVYKNDVSEPNRITSKNVTIGGETSVIDVRSAPTDKPLDQVRGYQPKGVHVWNELNSVGQTKEKCIEHAKEKGYQAWGFRNADHSDGRYKNTCWFYRGMEDGHTGSANDFVHSTGCTVPGMKVSEGCGKLKMGVKGLDRWGGDIQNLPGTNLDACKSKCLLNPDCIGISHHAEQNHCFVKGYPGKTTNQMRNLAPAGGWQWYYRTDKPYSNSNMSDGWYNTTGKGTHVGAIGAGFEWNKNMTWEGCAKKAKELGYTAFGFRNSNDKYGNPNTCFFEKKPFNPYDGTAPLSNKEDNAYSMACTDPKKTITSGCRTTQASDDTKVLAGYNGGGHDNKGPWSENSGTMEDCRLNAIKHGYAGYGYRTDSHPNGTWRQRCFYFTQGHINQRPDWRGNPADSAHLQGCTDPSKDWPNCS